MDPLNFRPLPNAWPKGEDPCNPLYWYPRNIPEYCQYNKVTPKIVEATPVPPLPMPIPVPIPVLPRLPIAPSLPMQPVPMPPPMPMPPPIPMPMLPPMPIPMPQIPQFLPMPNPFPVMPPLPYGIPIQPFSPMLPVGGIPYPGYPPPLGSLLPPYGIESRGAMVPGLPGLVSPDGGINVLPFSDAYSELLEKHKQKMIRKKMEKIIAKYEYPKRGYRLTKKYRRSMVMGSEEDDSKH